jgi:hypothetical protein
MRTETVLAKEFATVWGRGERVDFGVLKKRSFLAEDVSRCVAAETWCESSLRRVENRAGSESKDNVLVGVTRWARTSGPGELGLYNDPKTSTNRLPWQTSLGTSSKT